ncbi:hypothetical protein CDAR_571461 [Caerostris darwini]|uniref:Uncharacterized protein n=1 Tax=Caerostris darwini TaxID=1538125 RepID=A0AAV4QUI5_9ARAC|nr:hypothetical protein CDAR_571461 [Caerostris darwini]
MHPHECNLFKTATVEMFNQYAHERDIHRILCIIFLPSSKMFGGRNLNNARGSKLITPVGREGERNWWKQQLYIPFPTWAGKVLKFRCVEKNIQLGYLHKVSLDT